MIYAMAAMVLLTTIVAFLTLATRFTSVKRGEVRTRYYKLMQGQEVPDFVIQTGRNFSNQFEVPVLFYAVAILHVVLNVEHTFALYLAWGFVALRYLHALIHLTYNHVLHRMISYFAAFFCVIFLWLHLVIEHS
ncbi:MAG: MAPEG family protein [Aestuariibacter sp.]